MSIESERRPHIGAAKEGAWEIVSFPGANEIDGTTVYVDDSDNDIAEYLRDSQMIYATQGGKAFNFDGADQLSNRVIQGLEKARCAKIANSVNISVNQDINTSQSVQDLKSTKNSAELVSKYISYHGLASTPAARIKINQTFDETAKQLSLPVDSKFIQSVVVNNPLKDQNLPIQQGKYIVAYIKSAIETQNQQKEIKEKQSKAKGSEESQAKNAAKGQEDDFSKETYQEEIKGDQMLMDFKERMDNVEKRDMSYYGYKMVDGKWMHMVHETPRLTKPHRGLGIKSPKPRPTDMGVVMRYPHRWSIDERIFSQKKPKNGKYNVLLDASGSMKFEQADIDTILKMCPDATVAMYCCNSSIGTLTILADKGKRVAKVPERKGYGNGVDGPALEWLAKQRGPKIWISDGHVHGKSGMFGVTNLINECINLKRKHKIKQVIDMNSAQQLIAKARKLNLRQIKTELTLANKKLNVFM